MRSGYNVTGCALKILQFDEGLKEMRMTGIKSKREMVQKEYSISSFHSEYLDYFQHSSNAKYNIKDNSYSPSILHIPIHDLTQPISQSIISSLVDVCSYIVPSSKFSF